MKPNMLNTKLTVALLGLLGISCGTSAFASTIPFAGTGASGTINPSSLAWTLTPNSDTVSILRGVSVWGTPGLGTGDDTWPAATDPAIAFTITFSSLPGGVTIDQSADPSPTAFDDFTRGHNADDTVIWTPTYTGGNTVTFNAPGGYSLTPGTQFYINIAFAGGTIDTVNFTGDFVTTEVLGGEVPEPGSLLLAGLGLISIAIFARKRLTGRS
jgi:hypothetical protein